MTTTDTSLPENLPGFDDPIGLLRACHEKMLAHCELLSTLVDKDSLDAAAREAARSISRYFSQSAALHHRDEEEDLFPRLNRQSLKIAELIHTLKKEHATLDALWDSMAPELKQPPEAGFSSAFKQAAQEFGTLYRQHIARENRELLPLASNSLSHQELAVIGESMAKRRGVKYSAM
ncbi:MAG: hemerythrin domain-containing protein [Gammaproteobacteria bacterium]